MLPGGGLIIDTPGMRALSVAGAADGVRAAFADVEALAARCEFGDCTHQLGRTWSGAVTGRGGRGRPECRALSATWSCLAPSRRRRVIRPTGCRY